MDLSLDMIRLQTYVSSDVFMSYANSVLAFNSFVEYFESFRAVAYRHLYSISENGFEASPFSDDLVCIYENNFILAYRHNTENSSKSKFSLVIKFNPNKCNIREGLLFDILNRFYADVSNVDVKSCDFAIDFKGISIDNVLWDKKRKQREVVYKGNQGKTIYLGERGSNGSTKIYDKAAEQKINGDWSRYETTVKFDLLPFSDCFSKDKIDITAKLPTAYFVDYSSIDCDIKLKCCLMCILRGDFVLSDFPKYLRKKITDILNCKSVTVVDDSCISSFKGVLSDFFSFYCDVISVRFRKPLSIPKADKIKPENVPVQLSLTDLISTIRKT